MTTTTINLPAILRERASFAAYLAKLEDCYRTGRSYGGEPVDFEYLEGQRRYHAEHLARVRALGFDVQF